MILMTYKTCKKKIMLQFMTSKKHHKNILLVYDLSYVYARCALQLIKLLLNSLCVSNLYSYTNISSNFYAFIKFIG